MQEGCIPAAAVFPLVLLQLLLLLLLLLLFQPGRSTVNLTRSEQLGLRS